MPNATDEDIERFVVQIGNDTDPVRVNKYKRSHCLIAPECNLLPDTRRMLGRAFGNVSDESTASQATEWEAL